MSAKKIVTENHSLKDDIEIRLQNNPKTIFKNIVGENESFDMAICNPPFHASLTDAQAGTIRKTSNLKGKKIPGCDRQALCEA